MMVFLGADRINHLRCLKDIPTNYGILAPSNVSGRFLTYLKNLPHITILDSGGFTFSYLMTIHRYLKRADAFGFNYVFTQDYLHDSNKTYERFKELERIHRITDCKAQLVPICQGKVPKEYRKAAEQYTEYNLLAVGGLLRKFSHKRHSSIDDKLVLEIMNELKDLKKNLFMLGAYSPKRESLFQKFSIWGADTTGWQLQYDYKKQLNQPEEERNKKIREWINTNIKSEMSNSSK